eukprot:Clim_evm38s119 gene=Clim_evmTU38s119
MVSERNYPHPRQSSDGGSSNAQISSPLIPKALGKRPAETEDGVRASDTNSLRYSVDLKTESDNGSQSGDLFADDRAMLREEYEPSFMRHFNARNRKIALGLFVFLAVLSAVLTFIFRKELFAFFEMFAEKVRSLGFWGVLLMYLALVATGFPPVFGYMWLLLLSGFIYGWYGFFLSWAGSVSGATACFLLTRFYFKDLAVRELVRVYPETYPVISRAIEQEGLKMVVLVRLAPYPFGFMNSLFAVSPVTFSKYIAGTAIAKTKLLVHTWIGVTLSDLSDIINGGSWQQKEVEIAAGIVGAIVAVVVMWWSYKISTEAIARHKVDRNNLEMEGSAESLDVTTVGHENA